MSDSATDQATSLRHVVSATEIADILGATSSSTVSNWRARHADFPMPLMRTHNAPFDLDEVLAWARRPDTPARLKAPLSAEWWWEKTVDAVRAVVGAPRTTDSMNPLRSHLAAVVLLRAALVGEVPGVRASARRWAGLVASTDPAPALDEEARRLEDAHEQLRGLLVDALRSIRIPPGGLTEAVRRLEDAAAAGVPSSRLLEVVLEHVSPAVHPKQIMTATSPELATVIAGMAGVSGGEVIYDPCVGEGGLVLACARVAQGEVSGFAQELDANASRMARRRFLVEPLAVDVGQPGFDTLREDQFGGRKADIVVADPPVAARASLIPWVDHVLDHLADGGRGIVAIPAYTITELKESRRRNDEHLRERLTALADEGHVATVTVLSHQTRRDVPGPMTAWLFERTPVPGRETPLETVGSDDSDEEPESRAVLVPAAELLGEVDEVIHRWSRSGRRPIRADAPHERAVQTADVDRSLTTLESELETILDRLTDEDPEAVRRVRRALGDLQTSLERPA